MLVQGTSPAAAAPPLLTHDTDIVIPGTWEIILYAAGESRAATRSTELPGLDLSHGLHPQLDVAVVIPRQVLVTREAYDGGTNPPVQDERESGWGTGIVEMRWRFHEGGRTALAVVPGLAIPLSQTSRIRGLIEDTYIAALPLVGSFRAGAWEFCGQLSYEWSSDDYNGVNFGVRAGWQTTSRLRLLTECWGFEFHGDEPEVGFVNWRLGVEVALDDRLGVLGAFGGSLYSELDPEDQLEHDFYLGLQYITD